jgi:hypothetical protein
MFEEVKSVIKSDKAFDGPNIFLSSWKQYNKNIYYSNVIEVDAPTT